MTDFYHTMQKSSVPILNGIYTPIENGVYKKFSLHVVDRFRLRWPPSKEDVEKLVEFAKKRYKFDSVEITEKSAYTCITFNNLKGE